MPDFVTFQPGSVADEVRPHSHSSPRSKVHCPVLRLHLLLRRQGSRPILPHFLLPVARPLWPPSALWGPEQVTWRVACRRMCDAVGPGRCQLLCVCVAQSGSKGAGGGVWPPLKICIQEVKHSNERRGERRGDGIIISIVIVRMPHIKCVHMRS